MALYVATLASSQYYVCIRRLFLLLTVRVPKILSFTLLRYTASNAHTMAPQQNKNDDQDSDRSSPIFENDDQKRGLVIVIVLCFLATVGMFCLIVTLVVLKNKRDRRKRAAKMDAEGHLPKMKGKRGRYHRLEEDGVWSMEMDGIRGNGGVYAGVSGRGEGGRELTS
jgi:hypothetical protein